MRLARDSRVLVPRKAPERRFLLIVEKLEVDLEKARHRSITGDGRHRTFDIAVLDDPFAQKLKKEGVAPAPPADGFDVLLSQFGTCAGVKMELAEQGRTEVSDSRRPR